MCSHYAGEAARAKLLRMGAYVPDDWVPSSGGFHVYPTQEAVILRKPTEADSGDEAVYGSVMFVYLFHGLHPERIREYASAFNPPYVSTR